MSPRSIIELLLELIDENLCYHGDTSMEYRLSKSKYLAGLQCEKYLWLQIHSPEKAIPPSAFQEHIMNQGTSMGLLAQKEFP